MAKPASRLVIGLVWAGLFSGHASAQLSNKLDRPQNGVIDRLTPVVAAPTAIASLQEDLRLLAFGHDPMLPVSGQVSLVHLDAQGIPDPSMTTWSLPRPDTLAKTATYATGLAFHPKLPLLYVWQDTAVAYDTNATPRNPILAAFDHLLIYDFSLRPPALIASLCRGDSFMNGQNAGALTTDGVHLYVPNMREPKSSSPQVGRFRLDADGLPDHLSGADTKLTRPERGKTLTAMSAKEAFLPREMTPTAEAGRYFTNTGFGSASGFLPISSEAVLASVGHGVLVWRPGDQSCVMNSLPIKGVAGARFAAHPRLPFVFLTAHNSGALHRVAHSDGYPTLLPEAWVLPEGKFFGPPAIVSKKNRLMVGGEYSVYMLNLDDKGKILPEVIRAQVLSSAVRALTYSERFDRLYVPVEVSK